MSENAKRYVVSSVVTFLAAFLSVLALEINTITLETIQSGAYAGIILAAGRAGVKALIEYFLSLLKK